MPRKAAAAVRLLPDKRYFDLFDLLPKLYLDVKDLEQRYFRLSRQWHPDLFARKSEAEQQSALDQTALLNDAYRTLRHPIKRAKYVTGEEEGESIPPPPELLEEVFELNMALDELRSGDQDARPQLESQQEQFACMLRQTDSELNALFVAYDSGAAQPSEIRGLLNRRKYIQNLVDEVEKALHARD